MDIHRGEARTAIQVGFVAPVPAGHEVVVMKLELEGAGWLDISEAVVVVDLTTGLVYADIGYWTAMKAHGIPDESPADDPARALGPAWRTKASIRGRSTGAVVSTKDSGDTNHACTMLFVVPPAAEAGYRG